MSMFGNIAVEAEMWKLLQLLDKIKNRPAEEQLRILRAEIEETREAAKSGWL